jgi:hypothetical protein
MFFGVSIWHLILLLIYLQEISLLKQFFAMNDWQTAEDAQVQDLMDKIRNIV